MEPGSSSTCPSPSWSSGYSGQRGRPLVRTPPHCKTMAKIRAIARCPDEPAREIDPAAAKALLADSNNLLWLDIEDPTDTEIGLLRREFAFHELALEDALTRGQRPKVDDYHGC